MFCKWQPWMFCRTIFKIKKRISLVLASNKRFPDGQDSNLNWLQIKVSWTSCAEIWTWCWILFLVHCYCCTLIQPVLTCRDSTATTNDIKFVVIWVTVRLGRYTPDFKPMRNQDFSLWVCFFYSFTFVVSSSCELLMFDLLVHTIHFQVNQLFLKLHLLLQTQNIHLFQGKLSFHSLMSATG